MTGRVQTWMIAGSLMLAALAPASAQSVTLHGSGVPVYPAPVVPLYPAPVAPPTIWGTPNYILRNDLVPPLYVNVPARPIVEYVAVPVVVPATPWSPRHVRIQYLPVVRYGTYYGYDPYPVIQRQAAPQQQPAPQKPPTPAPAK